MDVNHVEEESKKKQQIQSIFSVFSNLFSEKGRNGREFVSLINLISDGNVSVGTGGNVEYSLKRFVRALSSAHLYPQCASFAALTCLLKYDVASAERVLEILDAEMKGQFSKSEQGALNSCCVLTCGAIIQSGIYSDLSSETKENILKKLINAGKTKSYLSGASHRFLIDVVLTVNEEDFKNVIWPVYKKEIKSKNGEMDVNTYDFLLVCHSRFPQVVEKFILKLESSLELFIEKLVTLVIDCHIGHDDPVYERVGHVLAQNKKVLLKIWPEILNSNCSKSSFKDKTIITLFYFIIKNLREEKLVPKLLVPKFIETLILILSFRKTKKFDDNDCHALAKSSLEFLVNSLIKEEVPNTVRFKTIEKLMFYPANMKFEKKTGTKCIQSLVMHLNTDSLKQLAEIHKNIVSGELKKIVDEEENSEDWNNNEKQYVLHMFVKLLHHPSVKNEKEWKLEQIKFLFDAGFIRNFILHSSVQKCARDCFYKAIEIQMPNLEDVIALLDELVVHVNDKIEKSIVTLPEGATESWKKAYGTIKSLKKSKEKLFVAIHLLLIHMGLQLFSDSNLAVFNIDELLTCYSRLESMHKKKRKDEKEDLHWSEVTVDLMLSLLSRENKLWRYVVCNLVFPQMVKHITPSALHQIIDVVNPQTTDKVLNDDQSDGSDDGEDEENKEDGDEQEEDNEDDDEEEGEKSESSLTESENDENVTMNDQLRLAVKDALGMSAALTDQESVDMDNMDAEEERNLNERLSAAFKMFKSSTGRNNKKQTRKEKALTHFRFRVLDLVEIYVTNGPTLAGCLDLLFPLFNLLELSIKDANQRVLHHRVDSILKKLSGLKKFPDADSVTEKLILDHFEVLLSRKDVPSMIFVEMAPRISDCCAFLVRCSQFLPKTNSEIPLVSNYASLLDNFFHSRDNKLPISLFQFVLRSSWPGNWKLVSTLYDLLVDPTIKLFKKMKVIELLEIFYKNSKLHISGDVKTFSQLNQAENTFAMKFVEYLIEYEGKKVKANEKMCLIFFTKILSLVGMASQSFKKHRTHTKKPPQWKRLIEKMAGLSAVAGNKKSRRQLTHLAGLFDVTLPEVGDVAQEKAKKGKGSDSESSVMHINEANDEDEEGSAEDCDSEEEVMENGDASESSKRKKKSKGMSAEKMKMKKESVKLREAMGNEGIDLVPFSSLDVYSIPEDALEEEPPEPKAKKRKHYGDCANGNAIPKGHKKQRKIV